MSQSVSELEKGLDKSISTFQAVAVCRSPSQNWRRVWSNKLPKQWKNVINVAVRLRIGEGFGYTAIEINRLPLESRSPSQNWRGVWIVLQRKYKYDEIVAVRLRIGEGFGYSQLFDLGSNIGRRSPAKNWRGVWILK